MGLGPGGSGSSGGQANDGGAGPGGMNNAGSNGTPGNTGAKPKTLMDWLDPRKKKKLYTEGREYLEYGDEQISAGENAKRIRDINAQEATFAKEDLARSKIKTILDPEGDKSEVRRTAAKRKQKGRAGTLLSQGRETLG